KISEPKPRNSALSKPGALSCKNEPNELLHTNSANCWPVWAGVCCCGRISYSCTETPNSAACQAASAPANPPPTMISSFCISAILAHLAQFRLTAGSIFEPVVSKDQ